MAKKHTGISYSQQLKMPCLFPWHSDVSGRDVLSKPSVDCEKQCDSCGWNPKEAARRFREGQMELRVDPRWGSRTMVLVFPSKNKTE